jgi:hypothetical protein
LFLQIELDEEIGRVRRLVSERMEGFVVVVAEFVEADSFTRGGFDFE